MAYFIGLLLGSFRQQKNLDDKICLKTDLYS